MSEVDKEFVESEWARYCEKNYIDTDFDPDTMDEDEIKGALKSHKICKKAIERGNLTINEEGVATYECAELGSFDALQTLTFKKPRGDTWMSTDGKKATHRVAQLYGMTATLTGKPARTFVKLDQKPDVEFCNAITSLLAV